MPNFIYTAKDQTGRDIEGHSEASNIHELANILRRKNLSLISADIAGEESGGLLKKIKIIFTKTGFGKVSLVDKMVFTRHLSVMIEAGLSLNQSLQALSKQTKNPKFKRILKDVEQKIKKGVSFSNALGRYPKTFPDLYVNMVRVGESSGNLEEVLKKLAEQMKKNHELVSRVRGAMIYPSVIVATMIGIGVFMMIMVVPKLSQVFAELKIELPLSTRAIIAISEFLKNNYLLSLIGLACLAILLKIALGNSAVKKVLQKAYLRMPVFGPLIKKVNSARFAHTFSSLIESGVPIVESLKITGGTLGNINFKNSLLKSAEKVQEGKPLSKALARHTRLYPPMIIQMISVGEETGRLSDTLKTLADFYQEEIDNTTKNLSSVIEPIIMVVIGAAVAFFAISMIQPMYSMMGEM